MIKAIIIDDEQHCIDRLRLLLAQTDTEIDVLGSFKTVETGFTAIKKLNPNLLFLDVQIDDKTGFDLLKQCSQIDFNIIFTTAYDKYAVQAFKFSAIDYLLKPIDLQDLQLALDKLESRVSMLKMKQKLDILTDNLNNNSNKIITIPTTTELLFVPVATIMRCESEINYTTVYLKDKHKIVVAKTLKEFEEMLTDYGFFRIHNTHLINLSYIKSYTKGKGGSIFLNDGVELQVSTRRKEDFLKRISKL